MLITKKELANKIGISEWTLAKYLCTMDSYRIKSKRTNRKIQYLCNKEFLEILKAKFERRSSFGCYKEFFKQITNNMEKIIDEWKDE